MPENNENIVYEIDPGSLDLFRAIQDWHKECIGELTELIDTEIRTKILVKNPNTGEQVELPPEMFDAFNLGLIVAKEVFKKFPITIPEDS